MAMDPGELRRNSAGRDWVKQLRVVLRLPAAARGAPDPTHRSTKNAVNLLLANLQRGLKNAPKGTLPGADADKAIFNAIDTLLNDKVSESDKHKTKLDAVRKFREVLTAELAEERKKAQRNKTEPALGEAWTARLDESLAIVQKEEQDRQAQATLLDQSPKDTLDPAVISQFVAEAVRQGTPDHMVEQYTGRTRASAVGALREALARRLAGGGGDQALNPAWARAVDAQLREQLAIELSRLQANSMKATDTGQFRLLMQTPEGQATLQARDGPTRALALSCMSAADLRALDLRTFSGNQEQQALAEALKAYGDLDKTAGRDPALFDEITGRIAPATWNDSDTGIGPQVFLDLWKAGNYDAICKLVNDGVDTTMASRTSRKGGAGVHSGFVEALQHYLAPLLRDVSQLDDPGRPLDQDPKRKAQAEGARKVLAAIDGKGTAVIPTSWKEVEESDLVDQFKTQPGTIWGFEHVREPFVQAAHETPDGRQPVRMLELWEAVESCIATTAAYERLLDDPKTVAREYAEAGIAKVMDKLTKSDAKFDDVVGEDFGKGFLDKFRRDAERFLLEFAAQMPKSTYARPSLDAEGKPNRRGEQVSNLAGIVAGKLEGSIACKAGLWWAKEENKPVYYCLDGIDMSQVTDYKKVKKLAIDKYLAGGADAGKGHDAVITFVELREILKNWDSLKDTVRFFQKGKLLDGDDLKDSVARWQADMDQAKRDVGRLPAPAKATFRHELDAIDKTLFDRFERKKGDQDARDLVRKFGYIQKVAKTHPHIVLRYILNKCGVLVEYDLIHEDLIEAAADFANADSPEKVQALERDVTAGIALCHQKLRAPLTASLLRHPLLQPAVVV